MGCQMNVLDSELVAEQLRAMGHESTRQPDDADIVLINTCSVRQHAEDKVYSRLGELKHIKKRRPHMIIGVIGCMAERDGDNVLARCEQVDLLCGPGQLARIPELLSEVIEHHRRPTALTHSQTRRLAASERSSDLDGLERLDLSRHPTQEDHPLQSYVRVQRGCDKFCSFCIVPFTRGPEVSRPPANIVEESRRLIDAGVKEITLLGQTVNSYAHKENGRVVRFAELLHRVHEIPDLMRLRFVTSYPGDFTDDILEAMRDLPRLCEYLHIPAQSGSNTVLQRMKRQYTAEEYFELMERARTIVPDISLAGDFIVGFSGETEEDFEKTVEMVKRVRYKNIFVFKYSVRPGTAADRSLADDIPNGVKRQRNTRLLEVQQRISLEENKKLVGREVEVLVEGYSKAAIKAQEAEQARGQEISWRRTDQLIGRTPGDQIVVFAGTQASIGRLVKIRIAAATALTLHGDMVEKTT